MLLIYCQVYENPENSLYGICVTFLFGPACCTVCMSVCECERQKRGSMIIEESDLYNGIGNYENIGNLRKRF